MIPQLHRGWQCVFLKVKVLCTELKLPKWDSVKILDLGESQLVESRLTSIPTQTPLWVTEICISLAGVSQLGSQMSCLLIFYFWRWEQVNLLEFILKKMLPTEVLVASLETGTEKKSNSIKTWAALHSELIFPVFSVSVSVSAGFKRPQCQHKFSPLFWRQSCHSWRLRLVGVLLAWLMMWVILGSSMLDCSYD